MDGTTWALCDARINFARGHDERDKRLPLPRDPSLEVIRNRIDRVNDDIDRENRWWNNHRHNWTTPHLAREHNDILAPLKVERIELQNLLKAILK